MSKPSHASSNSSLLQALRSEKTLTYVLGLIGWLLVLQAMPFDWALPTYAEF